MSGQIFISYRREDASHPAGRLYDRLAQKFPKSRIFMDTDTIDPGENFEEAIEKSVGSCDILIAVIGQRWLDARDPDGNRRLDNPNDFVRLEIFTALKRGICVMPVLVDGAVMPQSIQLPEDLQPIVRRQATGVGHNRFATDAERIIKAINREFEKAAERPGLRLLARLSFIAFVLVLLSWLLPFQSVTHYEVTKSVKGFVWGDPSRLEVTGAAILFSNQVWASHPKNIALLSAFVCVVFLVSSHSLFLKYRWKAILELVVAWICFVSVATWILFPVEGIPDVRIGSCLACMFAAAGAVTKTILFKYRRKAAKS